MNFPGLAELVRLYGPAWGTITLGDIERCPHGIRETCRCTERIAERAYCREQAALHDAFRWDRCVDRWANKHSTSCA